MELTVSQIAKKVQGELVGQSLTIITGVASIHHARPEQISFVKDASFAKLAKKTRASALLVPMKLDEYAGAQIICENPHLAFITVANLFLEDKTHPFSGVHKSAVVRKTARIGKNVSIGPHVYVGEGSTIGANSVIYPNVTICDNVRIGPNALIYSNVSIREDTRIGKGVIIHCNSVVGDDGFGYIQHQGKHVKVPQLGYVKIGNDVEIGSNVTIDRAALDRTVIGNGVKIDNHSHIAHNVEIGDNSLLIAFAKIAGSAKIGNHVVVAEDVGITDNITIGDGCIIGGGSKVYKSVKGGDIVWGAPAKPIQLEKQVQSILKKLPEMRQQLKELLRRQGDSS